MNTYMTKDFRRRARRARVTDEELIDAANEIIAGRIDAKLGAHLVKQRVSEGQGGRTNSQRAIVAFKEGERIVFLHMFAKNVQANVTPHELKVFKNAAKHIAALPEDRVADLVSEKEWIEIENPSEEKGLPE